MRPYRKPPPYTRLDPSHPLSRNCFGAYLLGEGGGAGATKIFNSGPYNAHGHGTLKNFTGDPWSNVGPFGGKCLTFDATNDYVDLGNHSSFHGTMKAVSIYARFYKNTAGTLSTIFNFRNVGTGWAFYVNTGGALAWWNGSAEKAGTAGTVPTGAWCSVGVTNDESGNLSFYVNGVLAGTNTGGSIVGNTGVTAIGANDLGATGPPGGRLEDVRYWIRRGLGAGEHQRLHNEPFIGYDFANDPVSNVPPISYSMAAGAASFTLSGQSVGLTGAMRMAADAAAFTLTGKDVSFNGGSTLVADAAHFFLEGKAVDFLSSQPYLPRASAGLHYYLYVRESVTKKARSGDTIYDGASTGTTLASSDVGSILKLVSPARGLWFVERKSGTWTLS